MEEFARHGYDAASTNRIAQRAQVAKGLLFRHFGSKEGVLDAALQQACDVVFAWDGKPLPGDPFERLEAFVARRVARITAHPVHARLVAQFRPRLTAVLNAPARRIEAAYAPLRAVFRDGVDGRSFRAGIRHEAALEVLLLVAEGLEGRVLDALWASAPVSRGGTGAAGVEAWAVHQQVQGFARLLRHGLYRPGARASPQPAPVDPAAFLELPARLAPAPRGDDQRRERILGAAQRLFAQRGYDGTTAEAIAAQAGVAKGLIFHHFGSKAALYLSAVADAITRISTAFFQEEEAPEPDLLQRLLLWTQRKIRIFQKEPTLYRLVLSAFVAPPPAVRDAMGQYLAEGTQRGWGLILDGVDTAPFRPGVELGQAVELVMLVLNTFIDRTLRALAAQSPPPLEVLPSVAERVGEYLGLLRDGLAPGETGQGAGAGGGGAGPPGA